ncbi:isatin hydrolase-like [Paramacrobiotus metropolitanus]|uniref:isatin hydrolase-like n=1 Tax=Paramacrobiotus metropolitanus TaxID=2943436 RepID=UPI002445E6CD|nr:isatin hydrolase-like [Paramacrobiotus metropolitanus]
MNTVPFISFCSCVFVIGRVYSYPVEKFKFSPGDIVDLTYPFNPQTVYFPQKKGFNDFTLRIDEKLSKNGDVVMRQGHFQAGEHGGTHLDSPAHFGRNGKGMSDLSTEQLVGPAVIINVTTQVRSNPDYYLNLTDIHQFEATHGRIPDGSFVFLYGEWGKRWPDRQRSFGAETPHFGSDFNQLHFPGFDPAATRFLIAERNIRGLGTDGPSVDSAAEIKKEVAAAEKEKASAAIPCAHLQLATKGKIAIEYAAHLEKMPPIGGRIILAPMKNKGGSGAPTRIYGIRPSHKIR